MRFTIRELLLLTLVVALAAGWALDHAVQRSHLAGAYHTANSYFHLIRHLRRVLDKKSPGWEASDPPPSILEPEHTR